MRIGKAWRPDHDDVDWQTGALTIRQTTVDKSRSLALHTTIARALHRYPQHVNDTLGHRISDQLLAEWARRPQSTVHRHDIVARLGLMSAFSCCPPATPWAPPRWSRSY